MEETGSNLNNCTCVTWPCCCLCRLNLCPGQLSGIVRGKVLDGHMYCYACYPTAVDVYVADMKLEAFENERKETQKI